MINKQRLIRLTQKLIQINSENPPGNEAKIACFVKNYLERLRLKARLYEFAKNRPNVVTLLKGRASANAKTVLLSPHLDTVPAGRGWKFPPFQGMVYKEKIYGRGATDCKCNLGISLEVLNSLVEDGVQARNNILFAATSDEEAGSGFGLIPLLKKNIIKADYALILDSDEFDVVIAQKGLVHFRVSLTGRKAHGAYPWQGVNAIDIACSIIQDFKDYKFKFRRHALLHHPTINIGTIRGGDKVNMVADWCEFEADLRFLPGMNSKTTLAGLKKLIARRTKNFAIKIDGRQEPYEINPGHYLVSSLLKAWRIFRPDAKLKGSEGATVITFFKEKNIPAVATGFGSYGCAHTNDEYAEIKNLYCGAKALEYFIKSLR